MIVRDGWFGRRLIKGATSQRRRPNRLGSERLEPRHLLAAQPVISEFLADNKNGLRDEDGDSSDWIEIHNEGDQAIDLAGWHLTDSADSLSEWTFPSVVLEPDAYLIVFASGKDRSIPGSALHTSFQLDAAGEYLGLIHANGTTVASEYRADAGGFSAQREDISQGLLVESIPSVPVPIGAETKVLIATTENGGSSLATTWTGANEPFNYGLWSTHHSGLGFDTGNSGNGGFTLVDDFESLAIGDLGSQNGWRTSSTNIDIVLDPANDTNQVIQLTTINQFANKPISIPNTATASTLFFRMRRDGQTNFSIGASDVALPGTNLADYEVQLNLQDGTGTSTPVDQLNVRDGGAFRAVDTWSDDTWYNVWLVINNASNSYQVYMQGGSLTNQTLLDVGTLNNFAFRNGPSTNPLINFLLRTSTSHIGASLVDDIYIDAATANLSLPVEVDFGPHIAANGNLLSSMQNINASIFTRTTFELDDVSALDSLELRVQYDDGFVAYINGVEVARRNAPGAAGVPLAWNATASSPRDDSAAIGVETIDLRPFLSTLRSGTNILAIQGLNAALSDGDFLLAPSLHVARPADQPSVRYFQTPTPGTANDETSSLLGLVADTQFSGDPATFHDRGLYDSPFDVTLTTLTPGATLVYTTNGSQPTLANGTAVPPASPLMPPTATLHIAGTTTLRVAAFKSGHAATNVDTQTYLFPDQVIMQSGAGLPTSWGTAPAVDYGMDPEIYNDPVYQNQIVTSLKSLPTVSLTLDVADMWGPNGIYSNTMSQGTAWERAASLELMYPDGRTGFQINAGLQVQGGASREVLKSPKHSFRVLFKDEWGPDKLEFPLFGSDATDSFDAILLRAGFNNTWIHWDPTQRLHGDYVRDSWANATQRDMGHISKHDSFVHLYINGLYWGMYDMAERPEESFAATYLGGEKEDYDIVNNQVSLISGTITAWNQMMTIANGGVASEARYREIQRYLDLDNFIDYMIMNYYGANTDWDDHNWYAARRSRVDGLTVDNTSGDPQFGFQFFNFDGEHLLELTTDNRTTVNNANRPTRLHNQLMGNAEYKLKFADRVQKHLFHDGALTPEAAGARYAAIANRIQTAVIAESARWGDYRRDVHAYQTAPYQLFTPVHWQTEQTRLRTQYFPARTAIAINQLIARGWFPSIAAPAYSVGGTPQHGGVVASGVSVTIAGTGGTIYYTLDGTDPRLANQGLSPSARMYDGTPITIDATTRIASRLVNGTPLTGTWSALSDTTFVVQPAEALDLAITEVNYNPSPPTLDELAANAALTSSDFEFVEIRNVSDQLVSLHDAHFTNGIEFRFARQSLAPGEYGVVVSDVSAFTLRYGAGIKVLGEFFSGSLSNAGERITLNAYDGSQLFDLRYDDDILWPLTADGIGATLENLAPTSVGDGRDSNFERWRGSTEFGGSPGRAGDLASGIVVNEILAHTDSTLATLDAIELLNTSNTPVNIGGWYLSDASSDLLKFRIPNGTVLQPGEFRVFDERDFNPMPLSPGPDDFALSGADGDEIFLVVSNGAGGIATFVDAFQFGATGYAESLGRQPNGSGRLAPMRRVTLGCHNGAEQVGPLVISEVQYQSGAPSPAALALDPTLTADDLEFVEIHNPTLDTVLLTNWRLRGGIEFDFEEGTSLLSQGTLVILSFNPGDPANALRLSGFRTHYGIDNSISLLGGYQGGLSSEGDRVQLQRPDAPPADQPTLIPRMFEDEVTYDELQPWSPAANGTGASLTRTSFLVSGNSSSSWAAQTPSPGTTAWTTIPGDFNGDSNITADDIDALYDAIRIGSHFAAMDMDANGSVNAGDVAFLLSQTLRSQFGDINLDGVVDGSDFNRWNEFKYTSCGVGWQQGDVNGDTHVDGSDFNQWFTNRFSVRNPSAAPRRTPRAAAMAAVPAAARIDAVVRPERIERRPNHSRTQLSAATLRRRDESPRPRTLADIDQVFGEWETSLQKTPARYTHK